MRSTLRRVVLFLLGSLVGAIPAFGAETARPFRLDDIFELEDVGRYYGGPWAFSPDGQSLAFTRIRAKKTLANHKWEYLWGNSGGDVWLQPAPGEKATVLTDGLSDGSGWWAPQWSPDGKRLAMLSTRGGNVGLWVMEIGGKPRRLTERGVDISAVYRSPFLWIDGSRILCPLLPEGEQPMSMRVELSTPQIAMREWPKVPAGKEVTASVLQSGVPVDLSKRPQGQLLLIDAETGASKVVVEQNTVGFHASPRGDRVAYCRQVGVYTPKADEPLRFAESGTYTIDIRSLDGTPVRLNAPLPGDVLKESLRWSPGGRELAFFAFGEKRSTPPALFRVDVEAGSVTRIDVSPLDAEPAIRLQPQLEWISGDGLLFLAVNREKGGKPSPTDRRDWWLAPREGKRRILTEAMKQVPGELWPQDGRRAFVGVAGDQLWRLQPSEGRIVALTEKPAEGRSTSIAWPVKSNVGQDEYAPPGRTYAAVVLGEREGQTTTYSLLDIVSGRRQPIARPAADAEVMALGPRGSTVFLASGKDGTFAWRTPASGGAPDVLMAANTFLRGVIEGELQPIEYLSLNGQKLKGWILLPIGYEKGRRYPTIAWVYAGYLYSDRKPYLAQAAHGLSLNMQIPASRGFAVLFPSMPMKQEGEVDEPMLRLQEGVQPALDKAVELGVADPERLFVMGQSFGGFSTYGLVTQTSRFKAAVALAGLSDFISLYTQFDARMRYEEFPHENLAMAGLFESAQTAMGSPPWKDLGRYMRNSPIFYVERVETPVMIVQGDLDYVAIQQGEEFFTSLYRQGKRAEFVRYWGEGHVLESPANIRDMWTRIEAWLDEFGDVTRDARCRLDFDGDRVRSRKPKEDKSAAPSKP